MKIHGILACAGNGTRFAQSVNKPHPYPKHLEMLGDKSVLARALDGLRGNIPLDHITFTLNPLLQNLYLEHLRTLQDCHPEVQFSYSPIREGEASSGLFTRIRRALTEELYDLEGTRMTMGNPITAIALGDSVVTQGDKVAIGRDLKDLHTQITEGKSLAIFRDVERGGLIYWVSRFTSLGEELPDYRRAGRVYGLKWWNCNSIEDLSVAREQLGITVENNELEMNYKGKERG